MPRGPADVRKSQKPAQRKRDPRLRPLRPPVDPWAWVLPEPSRKSSAQPVAVNVHGRDSKPSFLKMVKAALMADKMQYVRGVSASAIYKHVAANWPVEVASYRRLTRQAINKALDDGILERVDGPTVAYRLAPAHRPTAAGENAVRKAGRTTRSTAGVSSSRRGVIKRASSDSDSDSSSEEDEPAPKKRAATQQQQLAKGYRPGDFAQQQPGEGKWIWQFLDGNWRDYDPAASDEVEQTYQLYEREKSAGITIDVRAVKSGQWKYEVNFRSLRQRNVQHEAHTERPIRRVWRSL